MRVYKFSEEATWMTNSNEFDQHTEEVLFFQIVFTVFLAGKLFPVGGDRQVTLEKMYQFLYNMSRFLIELDFRMFLLLASNQCGVSQF